MKTTDDHDARLAEPLAMLTGAEVSDLITSLRRIADALELHYALRREAERSRFDDRQLDMWNGANPF